MPIFSGIPWSGQPTVPTGGIQFRASPLNSGNLYMSLSGAYQFSGQMSTLVGSGGPTINSGTWGILSGGALSGWGLMDGMLIGPGDTYFIPKIAEKQPVSGQYGLCVGQDLACSGGFGRLFYDIF